MARQKALVAGVRVFDSGTRLTGVLDPELLVKRPGWTEVPEDELTHEFKGDAVVFNTLVAFVLRRGARGAEVYSLGSEAAALRAVLAPGEGVFLIRVRFSNSGEANW